MHKITEQSAELYQSLREAKLLEIRGEVAKQVREEITQAYQPRLLATTAKEQQQIKRQMENEIKQQTKVRCDALLEKAGLPETSPESLW